MEVEAPRIASAALPGEFLIVRAEEKSERIPLTICDYDRTKGSVTTVTQIVGASTKRICSYNEGDGFRDMVGPLGQPSDFTKVPEQELVGRRFLFIAGGLGAAPVYPQVKFLHRAGASVDVIMGARSGEMIIMEEEMRAECDHLYICTDDGSKGRKGLVTQELERVMVQNKKYDRAVAIGPMTMMKYTAIKAAEYHLPLTVSLNTLMVDGTGMCGACRVTIAGETKFACVDGPEFDACDVDFDEAIRRQGMYRTIESEKDHKCKIGLH